MEKFRFFQALEMTILKLQSKKRGADQTPLTPRIPIEDFSDYLRRFLCIARQQNIIVIMVGLCAAREYIEAMSAFAEANDLSSIDFFKLIETSTLENDPHPEIRALTAQYLTIYGRALLDQERSFYFLFPDRCHPNALGHKALADALVDILGEKILP